MTINASTFGLVMEALSVIVGFCLVGISHKEMGVFIREKTCGRFKNYFDLQREIKGMKEHNQYFIQ